MELNLQKDLSLTHSLAVVRGTGNTGKEKPTTTIYNAVSVLKTKEKLCGLCASSGAGER